MISQEHFIGYVTTTSNNTFTNNFETNGAPYSSLARMHIHRLTDNEKVISLPKNNQFWSSKIWEISMFSKRSQYSLRQPSPTPLSRDLLLRSRLVRLFLGSHLPAKKRGYVPVSVTGFSSVDWDNCQRAKFRLGWISAVLSGEERGLIS